MESSTSSKHAIPTFHSTWIKVPSCERKAESSSVPLDCVRVAKNPKCQMPITDCVLVGRNLRKIG